RRYSDPSTRMDVFDLDIALSRCAFRSPDEVCRPRGTLDRENARRDGFAVSRSVGFGRGQCEGFAKDDPRVTRGGFAACGSQSAPRFSVDRKSGKFARAHHMDGMFFGWKQGDQVRAGTYR